MLVMVPLAGELKFYPVNETFRISFGAPTFFFFLLLFQNTPAVVPGFLTGATVVGFRILLDFLTIAPLDFFSSIEAHYSSFFFYFTYSLLFTLMKMGRFQNRTLLTACIGMFIEVLADLVELFVQQWVFQTMITWAALQEMLVIALSHSFIVLSFLNMMKLYEAQSRERQTRLQNEHMLMLISNLYEESIHLKKTLQNAENITVKSFDLYQELQELRQTTPAISDEVARQALIISGEVHEIKKDNQRVFAGLLKLISEESMTDYMDIHQLVAIIFRSNQKYAGLLGKDIRFDSTIRGSHPPYHVFTVLSLINNIVANAVEAIAGEGTISIEIDREGDWANIRISDDGPGVSPRRKKMIFKPGFTTKYDRSGNPSTGIGLSYVKEMVGLLHGDISVHDGESRGTIFQIRLRVEHIMQKE
ncbi:sensor histidine kinase [Brevibacillus choshinensis]|uniref:histidine kinase n=1 Tax=Brevibacillus choshinensis TaxID=54911 RepID=A0ABX7FY76_BRECH|nr:sensor histidine kinase [Brevibacillus choshinensis]QRG70761.1 sensor histidine kinase [Brevibacillus choshinensis]